MVAPFKGPAMSLVKGRKILGAYIRMWVITPSLHPRLSTWWVEDSTEYFVSWSFYTESEATTKFEELVRAAAVRVMGWALELDDETEGEEHPT